MIRIIIEDIKINKNNKKDILNNKKDVFLSELKEIKNNRKKGVKEVDDFYTSKYNNEILDSGKIKNKKPKKTISFPYKKFFYLILFLLLITGGLYFLGNYFQRINVIIKSKQETINYENKQFLASKNIEEKGIDFEIMIISEKIPKKLILTDSKEVSIKSKGSIILYNEFTTTPQKIIAGTFIEDNQGKTYKTDSTITIPGYKIENKKIIPGKAVVNISAFLAGENYNGSSSDFFVTSFKGTTKYSKIYGKLKEPLVGGVTGMVYFLNEKDLENIDKSAKTILKDHLLEKVKSLVPPDYRLYPDAYNFSYELDKNFLTKDPETKIDVNGNLAVVLFKEKILIDNIIKNSLSNVLPNELNKIKIIDLANLSFNFIDKNQIITKETNSFQFSLTGNLEAIWNPNLEELKTKLSGIPKTEAPNIFKQDTAIAFAELKIFPPWKSKLPEDTNKIHILVDKDI